jgi:RNA polymerase sigma factor (sigma-70 family)
MENAAQLNPRVAFEQMAVEYREQLLRYALSLTGDQSISEDLLQDTYLKALRAFGMFRVGSNFRAWINKIMLNTFINYYNEISGALSITDLNCTITKRPGKPTKGRKPNSMLISMNRVCSIISQAMKSGKHY